MIKLHYFGAPWCGPCRALKPTIKKLKSNPPIGVEVIIHDCDKESKLADEFGILSIPALVFEGESGKKTSAPNSLDSTEDGIRAWVAKLTGSTGAKKK